ncbi:histone-lysine n-methyltransferase setmar [Lasius niger]|uniref:Histone-lysine n-methyltransferase setmar n=1 Tax=Lasius niger TaxID=67767 RepID=A0A0J7KHV2_LASNI|nr:histone-lysine n-methyltransferase setmar [Lasius niger]KMQ89833.1 histone-lysine n-methyltransferase setmar [Lasius niger]
MNDVNGLKKGANLFVTTLEEETQMPQTREKLQTFDWEVFPHLRYSHLAPSDFHLFGPLKEYLGGRRFQSEDEFKTCVLQWFRRHDKSFNSAGINALVRRWQKCCDVNGKYAEK